MTFPPVTTALAIALLLAATTTLPSLGFAAEDQVQTSLADIRFEGVEVANVSSEAMEMNVLVSAIAKRTVTLRKLIFHNVTIDGVRVQVQPLNGPIHLRMGEPVAFSAPIMARISYRELDSLDPIRRIISNGQTRVRTTVRAELQLNLFQQIALIAGGAWVISEVEQTVPVSLPGGTLGRLSVLAILVAGEPLWVAGQSAAEWRRNRTDVAAAARESAGSRLIVFETQYNLRSRTGEVASLRSFCSGFLVGNHQVLAPAEVIEPWLFDAAIAEAINQGEARVDSESIEVLATLVRDSSRVLSLKKKQIRISKMLGGSTNAISVVTKRRYRVRFRNSDSNAVLLQMEGWDETKREPEGLAELKSSDWQAAAVMRHYGARNENGARTEPSLWLTEVKIENGRIQLKDPADSTAFGSPVWINGGVAGLLQDEGSAAVIGTLLKKLR